LQEKHNSKVRVFGKILSCCLTDRGRVHISTAFDYLSALGLSCVFSPNSKIFGGRFKARYRRVCDGTVCYPSLHPDKSKENHRKSKNELRVLKYYHNKKHAAKRGGYRANTQ
jgi:hypothetical protein